MSEKYEFKTISARLRKPLADDLDRVSEEINPDNPNKSDIITKALRLFISKHDQKKALSNKLTNKKDEVK